MKEVLQTEQFAKWLRKLKDSLANVAIVRRIERLEQGNFGDSKSVGEKVFELRIDVGKGGIPRVFHGSQFRDHHSSCRWR